MPWSGKFPGDEAEEAQHFDHPPPFCQSPCITLFERCKDRPLVNTDCSEPMKGNGMVLDSFSISVIHSILTILSDLAHDKAAIKRLSDTLVPSEVKILDRRRQKSLASSILPEIY